MCPVVGLLMGESGKTAVIDRAAWTLFYSILFTVQTWNRQVWSQLTLLLHCTRSPLGILLGPT